MSEAITATLTAPVKLVIWDLDETFWSGTLSEGGATPIDEHVEMVRALVDRGIMCSICSKNDYGEAKAKLEEMGIWDLFVFPHIAWSPKGQAIAQMLEDMGLRAENVLFLDDNALNLQEAMFFNEGLMVWECVGPMTEFMSRPELAGKDDRAHSRLAHYRMMEAKRAEQEQSGLSNTEFLKQSEIKVRLITDIEDQMDRVVEILNRTNQLNFTKKRIQTDDDRADLERLLKVPGIHAGLVEVQDRYGSYGIVGFFCIETRFDRNRLHHFAFSCRTLNMGIEQWVWNKLRRPDVDIVRPVANPLNEPADVDWITEVTSFDDGEDAALPDRHIVLVGGCDLQQVSFYAGSHRTEFVNKQDENGLIVRYDDIGFFLNPRDDRMRHVWQQKAFVGSTLQDMRDFDQALSEAEVIVLSMYHSVPTDLLFTFGGPDFGGNYWGTIPPGRIRAILKDPHMAMRFVKSMHHRRLPLEHRLSLTRRSLAHADSLRRPDSSLFVLGIGTSCGERAQNTIEARQGYNDMARDFCAKRQGAHFVDLEEILDPGDFVDSDHYTRIGYHRIACFINETVSARSLDALPDSAIAV
jgi:FkbH-like protein